MTRVSAPQVMQALRRYPQGVTPSILSADLQVPPSVARAHLKRLASEGSCVRETDTLYRPLTDHEVQAILLARLLRYPQLEYFPQGLARKLAHLHLTPDQVHAHLHSLYVAGHVTHLIDTHTGIHYYGAPQ